MKKNLALKTRYKEMLVIALLILWIVFAWLGTRQKYKAEFDKMVVQEQKQAKNTAEDVTDSVRRNLHYIAGISDTFQHALRVWRAIEKFGENVKPSTLAMEERQSKWVSDPALKDLNEYLALIQSSLGVDLIYVVNAAGDSIASSNWNASSSVIGANIADREWFESVRNGQRGMQYAVGKATHKAGLYFASPIMQDGRFMGAIVVKMDMASLSFLTSRADAYLVDSNGVIILAHDADMEMMAVPGASVNQLSDAKKIALYQRNDFPELKIETWKEHATLKRVNKEAFPHALAGAELPEYHLQVFAENDMPSFFALERERFSTFLLMSVLGCAVILIAYAFFALQRTRNAALESSTRLRLILESANCGIWGQTTEGVCTFINKAAAKTLGYEAHELVGQALHSIVHHTHSDGSNYPRTACPMYATSQDGKPRVAADEVLWRKDGSRFEVEYATSPIYMHGSLEGAVIIFNDVTERNQQAHQLELAKNKAEAANRAKSDFLANMSHEIRTPMNAVIGFSELALDSDDEKEKQSHLRQILESSKSLLGILNDILDFSKIEARQMSIENKAFDLNQLMNSLDRMFTLRAQEKGLTFVASKTAEVPDLIVGDELRLRQVLTNLLGNAIKFTASGKVALQISQMSRDDQGVMLDFCISDTGIGMTQAQMDGLFKPFVQADNSITRRFGGTGLGLSISRNLAQLMGGDIVTESKMGEGSAFHLQVKLAVPSIEQVAAHASLQVKTPQPAQPDTELPLQGKRILLVEDNRVNQVLATRILQKFGVEVDVANHGGEAIQKLQSSNYDVVLMDIQMPVMDGLEATRLLRQDARFAQLPIIAMSAGVTLDEQALCAEVGMTDFVGKPINSAELQSKLIALCDNKVA